MATPQAQSFAVPPPPAWAWWLLAGLAGLLPLGIIGMLALSGNPAHGATPALFIIPMVLALLLLTMRRRSVMLHNGVLEIRAALYTQNVAVSELDTERARIVDLAEHTELKPFIKTNGFATPGFTAGYFRLREHFGKAFCLITNSQKVLWLPRRDGKTQYLISLERPQALLDALRASQP